MLLHHGVIPYVVFDGDYLPSKSYTEIERASKRQESRKLGLELYRLGKISQAHLELQKAVDVTPEMAGQFITELKKLGVQYLVAPYEADAQLAYLERKGIIDGILSEDSDLLVFGAKCLLTKLDQYGDCIEINRKDFTACREVSLVGWSDAEFRCMAILSGCDYLTNISRMGLKTAYRLVRKHKTIEKILRILAFNNQHQIPPGYLESFQKANMTFLHQRVFCPVANDIVMMTSLGDEPEPEDFSFIGSPMDKDIAIGVSRGELNPMTKKLLVVDTNSVGSTPKTPWGGVQKQASTPFSDIKGNKSIEAFFKSQRTPLAELDPNSFTPSPNQQRLLLQRTTWTSSPAPAILSASQPNFSTTATASLSKPIKTSLPECISMEADSQLSSCSSKRRRLCSEFENGQAFKLPANINPGRSRFFAAPLPNLSPSIMNKQRRSREKRTELNIWSDDSIDDVMAGLPDVSESLGSNRSTNLRVFRDENQGIVEAVLPTLIQADSLSLENSQASFNSHASIGSSTSISTGAASVTSSSLSVAQTLNENVSAELAALNKNFLYQPSLKNLPQQSSTEESPREKKKPKHLATKTLIARQGSMTPLQRLGAGALNRSLSYSGLELSVLTYPSKVHGAVKTSDTPGIPKVVTNLKKVPPMIRGSEDLIIPDSEDDPDDEVSAPEADAPYRPNLDLGRFVFTT